MHRRLLKDMHEGRVVAGEMFRSLALPILPDATKQLVLPIVVLSIIAPLSDLYREMIAADYPHLAL